MTSCENVAKLLRSDQLQAQSWCKRTEVRLYLAMCRFKLPPGPPDGTIAFGRSRSAANRKRRNPNFEGRLIRRLSGR
jgi:hypothetical protein